MNTAAKQGPLFGDQIDEFLACYGIHVAFRQEQVNRVTSCPQRHHVRPPIPRRTSNEHPVKPISKVPQDRSHCLARDRTSRIFRRLANRQGKQAFMTGVLKCLLEGDSTRENISQAWGRGNAKPDGDMRTMEVGVNDDDS
jgi:hypothetical protein